MHRPGALLAGRYRLEERIGAGGMGEVWRATDGKLERQVAVKVMLQALSDDPSFRQRFRAEARALARVNHPGVVAIHDFDDEPSAAMLVMEYIAGEPLSTTLRRDGRLASPRTMELVAQAADALHAAHEHSIIHRDVKPANLLIRHSGGVVLTDFGIVRLLQGTPLTATGAVLGTLSYLAPEQVLGQPATEKSDVYALGVVAYECLTGYRPFDRENPGATMMARVNEAPPTLPATFSPTVCIVLERALASDPADRWPSAKDFAHACRDAIAPRSTLEPAPIANPVRATARVAGTRNAFSPGTIRQTWSADPHQLRQPASIDPIAIRLPGLAAEGYTLRSYRTAGSTGSLATQTELDETAVFLSHSGRLLLFATEEKLVSFVGSGEPHDLAELEDWEATAGSLRPEHIAPADHDRYDLDLLPALVLNLGGDLGKFGGPLIISATELARDLGIALQLQPVLAALAPGSLLEQLDTALLAQDGMGLANQRTHGRRLRKVGSHQAAQAWRWVITEICGAVEWRG